MKIHRLPSSTESSYGGGPTVSSSQALTPTGDELNGCPINGIFQSLPLNETVHVLVRVYVVKVTTTHSLLSFISTPVTTSAFFDSLLISVLDCQPIPLTLTESCSGKLLVPRVKTSTIDLLCGAVSVVASSIWNSLPFQIRLLPKSNTPLLYKLLKTDIFHRHWTESASEQVS